MRTLSVLSTLVLSASALPAGLFFQSTTDAMADAQPKKVPVLLGVMSRCPDAKICENVWDHVLDRVGGLVDIELTYIGKFNESAPYGVSCMHGDDECKGNIQQLCAYKKWLGVSGDVKPWQDWWNFVQCQNYGPSSQIGDESTAKECASSVSHNWNEEVENCAAGEEGIQLLHDSVQQSQALHITKSCTIVINGKAVCVHDGQWKQCEGGHEIGDFASQVKKEWKDLNEVAPEPEMPEEGERMLEKGE
ncbi:hypothetical protein MNV49_000987 [Pseudohyphozyma bogoriensis]|nr:hypothetical protein MNV49_000987 [Pseudohyphozyma bogoriensis]